jgi:hypothetical protein
MRHKGEDSFSLMGFTLCRVPYAVPVGAAQSQCLPRRSLVEDGFLRPGFFVMETSNSLPCKLRAFSSFYMRPSSLNPGTHIYTRRKDYCSIILIVLRRGGVHPAWESVRAGGHKAHPYRWSPFGKIPAQINAQCIVVLARIFHELLKIVPTVDGIGCGLRLQPTT